MLKKNMFIRFRRSKDQPIFNNQIHPVGVLEPRSSVEDRQPHLIHEADSLVRQFQPEATRVRRFEESRSQFAVHSDCAADYAVNQRIRHKGHALRSRKI